MRSLVNFHRTTYLYDPDQEADITGIPEASSGFLFSQPAFLIFNSLIQSGFCRYLWNGSIDPIKNQPSEWAEPFPNAQ